MNKAGEMNRIFESLLKEANEISAGIDLVLKERDALKVESSKFREALEYYANKEIYFKREAPKGTLPPAILIDLGGRAREALGIPGVP